MFYDVDGNVPSETLGLMQQEEYVIAGMGMSASHSFLHLTLQEYLTAMNYCTDKHVSISKLFERDGLFPLKNFLKRTERKENSLCHLQPLTDQWYCF